MAEPPSSRPESFDAVVLDTTVLWQDLLTDGVHFTVFFAGLPTETMLAVPQVVIDEASRHFRERKDRAIADLDNACRELARLGERVVEPNVEHMAGGYPYPLGSATRWRAPVTFLPYPSASHEEVAARDLLRRRPFQVSGKGYRDTLTWLSILQLIATGKRRLAFISGNTDDFALPKTSKLHPDLDADLPRGAEVHLFTSLERFNSDCIVPNLEPAEQLRFSLDSGAFDGFRVRDWVQAEIHSLVPAYELRGVLYVDDGHRWNIRSFKIDDLRSVRVTSALHVGGNEYLLRIGCEVTVAMAMRRFLFPQTEPQVEWRSERGTVRVTVEAIFDAAKKAVITGAPTELAGRAGLAVADTFARTIDDDGSPIASPVPEGVRVFIRQWTNTEDQ